MVTQLARRLGLVGPTALPPAMEEHKPGLTGTVLPTGNREFLPKLLQRILEAFKNIFLYIFYFDTFRH